MPVGKKPKPAKIKILEGNRGHRPIPKNPEPKEVSPKSPKWLDKYAREEYKRMVKILNRLGILTEVDLKALEAYCQCYARWRSAEEAVQKSLDAGEPNVTLMNTSLKYVKEMRMYLTEFGMTPSSRTRIVVNDKKQSTNEWDGVLSVV